MNNISPNNNNISPNKQEETFDFSTAIKEVVAGKKITKLEWANSSIYGMLRDEILMLHKEDDKFYSWILSTADILGEDYIVII